MEALQKRLWKTVLETRNKKHTWVRWGRRSLVTVNLRFMSHDIVLSSGEKAIIMGTSQYFSFEMMSSFFYTFDNSWKWHEGYPTEKENAIRKAHKRMVL